MYGNNFFRPNYTFKSRLAGCDLINDHYFLIFRFKSHEKYKFGEKKRRRLARISEMVLKQMVWRLGLQGFPCPCPLLPLFPIPSTYITHHYYITSKFYFEISHFFNFSFYIFQYWQVSSFKGQGRPGFDYVYFTQFVAELSHFTLKRSCMCSSLLVFKSEFCLFVTLVHFAY